MKRISVTVFALTTALSTFAYYGDYGYSSSRFEMPGWLTFIGIMMIVWGILEIILFFKIWGMTNDVRALKEDHFYEKAQTTSFLRKNLILGNIDNVKRILLQKFVDNVEHAYGELQEGVYENGVGWVSYKEKNMKESITPYVKTLISQYAKIGEEVPAYITRMETFGDYYSLMTENDLLYPVSPKISNTPKVEDREEQTREEQTDKTETSSKKNLYYIKIPAIAIIAFFIGIVIFHANYSYTDLWVEESTILIPAFIVFAVILGFYYAIVSKMKKE